MNPYLEKLRAKTQTQPVQEVQKLQEGGFCSFCSTHTGRIPEIEAANDPAPQRPLQPRPAVLRQPQHPGNAAEEALAVLDKLHAWGVVLTLDGNRLQAHGLLTLPPLMREEVDALMHPAVYGRDLIDAVQARDAAMAAIEQASLQRCWGCSRLQPSRQGNPQCTAGHAVAWREVNPGLRIMPLRVSKAGPCADYRQEGDHGH